MNILDALDDPKLFRPAIRDMASWDGWRAFLAALFALPLPQDSADLYRACTGRAGLPERPFSEAWLICGRRAGKSFVLALVAVYLACFRSYTQFLSIGERGTVMIVAADRRQARTILRYVRGLLELPMLKHLVERPTAEGFDLSTRVTIEVGTCSIKAVRGYTIVAALCDELAFWASEDSANPDREVLDSLRPGMATVPGAMLLCATSPYARKGATWDAHRRHYGKDGSPVLVWQAATRTMNPTVPQAFIDNAMEADASSASAEYLAEFRSDIESFVSRDVVDAAVVPGRHELGRVWDRNYVAFVDPSGGSVDSMALAIAHREDGAAVLDAVREIRPPFSPESVVLEFVDVLKAYGIYRVVGDRYGGEWPREQFRKAGIEYEVSTKSKSDLYREMLPLLNSKKVELLDNQRLVTQICGLERRTARGGKDSIDHAPGAGSHDDLANVAAGALVGVGATTGYDVSLSWVGSARDADANANWRLSRSTGDLVLMNVTATTSGPTDGLPLSGAQSVTMTWSGGVSFDVQYAIEEADNVATVWTTDAGGPYGTSASPKATAGGFGLPNAPQSGTRLLSAARWPGATAIRAVVIAIGASGWLTLEATP